MNEILEFMHDCHTYFLATVEGDQPRVRAFGTFEEFEGKFYIQTGKKKAVYRQLIANPKAELIALKDGKWLRLSGTFLPDERPVASKDMLDKNPSLRSMYDENDGNCIVFYIKDGTATFSSFTEEPRTIRF